MNIHFAINLFSLLGITVHYEFLHVFMISWFVIITDQIILIAVLTAAFLYLQTDLVFDHLQ